MKPIHQLLFMTMIWIAGLLCGAFYNIHGKSHLNENTDNIKEAAVDTLRITSFKIRCAPLGFSFWTYQQQEEAIPYKSAPEYQ